MLNDAELVKRLATGDVKAFDDIYMRYVSALWKYATRETGDPDFARDAVQDVMVRVWDKRNTLGQLTNLRAYLYGGVRNRILNEARHARVINKSNELADKFMPPGMGNPVSSPSDQVETTDLAQWAERIITGLPDQQREILKLRVNEGLEFPEIAEVLGISLAAAQKGMQRALGSIRAQLPG